MIKIFILYVVTQVYGGVNVSFQEFNSLAQCNYVRDYVYKSSRFIQAASCFEK